MRLAKSVHTARPWRIHELARDFRLLDVWALPTPGGSGDFPVLVERFASGAPARSTSRTSRALWAVRLKVGALLGWDDEDSGLDVRVASLRQRLPEDLAAAPAGPEPATLPFRPLYLLDDEWAAELANRTVHGILHLGWVRDGGSYRGEMAVYIKPNGLAGSAYMAAITPFRHLVVYPQMLRQLERDWRARGEVRTRVTSARPLVRAATPADADALGEVHVRAWQRAYRGGLMPDAYLDGLDPRERAQLWRHSLQRPPRPRSARFVVDDARGVAGFVVVGPSEEGRDGDVGEVFALNVDPEAWGTGCGTALLDAGVEALAAAGFESAVLWVHPGNTRARRFYERHGWQADGDARRQDVLGVEVPEVRYRRPLNPA